MVERLRQQREHILGADVLERVQYRQPDRPRAVAELLAHQPDHAERGVPTHRTQRHLDRRHRRVRQPRTHIGDKLFLFGDASEGADCLVLHLLDGVLEHLVQRLQRSRPILRHELLVAQILDGMELLIRGAHRNAAVHRGDGVVAGQHDQGIHGLDAAGEIGPTAHVDQVTKERFATHLARNRTRGLPDRGVDILEELNQLSVIGHIVTALRRIDQRLARRRVGLLQRTEIVGKEVAVLGTFAKLLEDRATEHMMAPFALRPLVQHDAEQKEHVLCIGLSDLMHEVVHLRRTSPRCSAKIAM